MEKDSLKNNQQNITKPFISFLILFSVMFSEYDIHRIDAHWSDESSKRRNQTSILNSSGEIDVSIFIHLSLL